VATDALPFNDLKGKDAPLAVALSEGAGFEIGSEIISFGALVAITSVVLTLLFGQSRILFAMSRDGLMPRAVARVNPRTQTPVRIIGACGVVFAALFAFVVVNLGVIILRRTRPDLPRGYRVPFVPVFPIIGTLLCVYLMIDLPGTTWWRLLIWMAIGLIIYFAYGRSHSRLRRGEVVNPEAELEGRS
jgi:basic amino acid/polyamine antiporter, APA family